MKIIDIYYEAKDMMKGGAIISIIGAIISIIAIIGFNTNLCYELWLGVPMLLMGILTLIFGTITALACKAILWIACKVSK